MGLNNFKLQPNNVDNYFHDTSDLCTITPREFCLDFSSEKNRLWDYWYGDRYLTSRLNAFSLCAPIGEAFICTVIKKHIDQIDSPELKAEALALIQQEREHSKIHNQLNNLIDPDRGIRKNLKSKFDELVSDTSIEEAMALMAILEFKTILGSTMYFDLVQYKNGNPALDSSFMKFWYWHFNEEFEHIDSVIKVFNSFIKDEERAAVKRSALRKHWRVVSKLMMNASSEVIKNSLTFSEGVLGFFKTFNFQARYFFKLVVLNSRFIERNLFSEILKVQKDSVYLEQPFLKKL